MKTVINTLKRNELTPYVVKGIIMLSLMLPLFYGSIHLCVWLAK